MRNVQTLGYIASLYGNKSIGAVKAEIERYAGWASKANGISVNGIFFDESPTTMDEKYFSYLAEWQKVVKGTRGLGKGITGASKMQGFAQDTDKASNQSRPACRFEILRGRRHNCSTRKHV